jgi:hypothetical protein
MKYIGGQMIKPRCLLYNMPIFLSADNRLKPCCFLNPVGQWNEFIEWGKQNGLNVEEDLDITKHDVETILKSPTWLAVLDGFKTGNAPHECHVSCGPNSYSSTSQTAKHSDYEENPDSSGLSSAYKEE